MKQDMILILDLGSEENPKIAREIRALGVYTEIHPHDITAEELAKLPGVKGIILNGGVNRVVDGVEIDASEAVYNAGLPILKADHKGGAAFPADDAERETVLKHFVFDTCKAEANWNMENFIADRCAAACPVIAFQKNRIGGVFACLHAHFLIGANKGIPVFQIEQHRRGDDGHTCYADIKADAPFFKPVHDTACRLQTKGRAARKHNGMHLLHGIDGV